MALIGRQLPPFNVPMPFGGVSESSAYSTPEEGTCLDEHNVVPFDPRTGRMRISKRPGLVNLFNEQLNGSTAFQTINEVVVAVTETIFKELESPEEEWAVDPGADLKAAVVDADGYVYVVGDRSGNLSVWKLDPDDGSTLDSFDTGANAKGIAITPNADTPYLHVVGLGTTGVHLWKLDTDLTSQWTADVGTTTHTMYGVAVDDDGNVYVTGDRNTQWNGHGSGSGVQRNVWKLDSTGAFIATRDLGATIDLVALALLENRTVAVCGPKVGAVGGGGADKKKTKGSAPPR